MPDVVGCPRFYKSEVTPFRTRSRTFPKIIFPRERARRTHRARHTTRACLRESHGRVRLIPLPVYSAQHTLRRGCVGFSQNPDLAGKPQGSWDLVFFVFRRFSSSRKSALFIFEGALHSRLFAGRVADATLLHKRPRSVVSQLCRRFQRAIFAHGPLEK